MQGEGFLSELMQDFVGVRSFFTTFQKQSISTGNSQSRDLKHNAITWSFLQETMTTVVAMEIPRSLSWLTCGRQSGRDSKMTSNTPMGTVICSSSRLLATLVLLSTRPTLSLEDTASWRRPMARLFSLADDRLRRLIRAWEKWPVGAQKRIKAHFTANRLHSGVLYVKFISVLSVYLMLLLTPCLFCWHWGSHLSFPWAAQQDSRLSPLSGGTNAQHNTDICKKTVLKGL